MEVQLFLLMESIYKKPPDLSKEFSNKLGDWGRYIDILVLKKKKMRIY